MFMTSTKRDATATDIATYDTFVQDRATNHGHADIRQYGAQFKVVGSTAAVDARDHTMTNPSNSAHPNVAIYWLNGPRVVDNNDELWSNQWDNWKEQHRKTEADVQASNDWHWTGTNVDGTKHTNHLGSSGSVRRGRFWINSGSTGPISHTDTARSESHSFYALSPVFQVAGEPLRHLPPPPSYRQPSFASVYEGERRNIVFEKVAGSSVSITVSTTAALNEFNLYYPHDSATPIPSNSFSTTSLEGGVFRSTATFSASVSNGLVKFAVEGLAETPANEETFSLDVTVTGPGLLPASSRIRLPDGQRPRGLLIRTKQGMTPEWVVGDNLRITLNEGGGVVEYQYKFHSDPYKDLYNPWAEVTKEAHVTPIVDPLGISKEGGNRNFFHLDPAADFDRISCVSTPDHGVSWRKGKKADEINDRVDNETGPFGHPYKSALHKRGLDAGGNTVDHDMHGGCDHKRTPIYSSNWDQWRSVKFQAGHDADADDHHFDIVHNVAIHADSSRMQAWPVRVHIVDDDKWEQELTFSATRDGTYTLGSEDGLRKALPGSLAPGTSYTFYIKLNKDPATLDRNTSISRRVNPVDDPDDDTDDATYHPTYQELETFVRVLGTTVLDNPSAVDYGPGHAGVFDISVGPTFKQPAASYLYADPGRPLTDTQRANGRTDWDEPVEVTINVDAGADVTGGVRVRVDTSQMLQRKDTQLPVGSDNSNDGHYYRTRDYDFEDWVVVPFSAATPVGMMSEQYTPPAIDAQIKKIAIGQLSDTDVKLTWGEMFGDQHYQVELDTMGGGVHSEAANGPVHVLDGLEPETEHTVQVFYVHEGEVVPGSGSGELTFTTLTPGSDPVTPANPIADLSASGTSITEGETAEFTLSLNPPPAEPLAVEVEVSYSYNDGNTDIGLAGQLGRRTVVVPTSGSAQIAITTTDNDDITENPVILLQIVDGDGYQKAQFGGAAQIAVLNDDAPPPNPVTMTRLTGSSVTIVWPPQDGVSMYEIILLAEGSHDIVAKHTSGTTIEFTGLRSRTMYEVRVWDLDYTPLGEKIRFRTLHPGEVWEAGNPEVGITAGGGVTEGGDATFTVTADPAPDGDLTVTVSISQDGDFGAATGARTVTIPTSGSATFSVATSDDSADERDGSVSAAVNNGVGYWVSSTQASATVAVADDDDAVVLPEVSVTAGSAITEGGTASFTVTVDPAPEEALTVNVTISQDGDFGATTGSQTVSIPTSGSATISVATSDDSADEPDGSVSATVNGGDGYTVSTSQSSASVSVSDDDDPIITPEVSIIATSGATEGGSATFALQADPPPAADLSVSATVTATGDFGVVTGQRTVTISSVGGVTVDVATTDDSIDESDGAITLTLNPGDGYTVGSPASSTADILDDDDPVVVTPEVNIMGSVGGTEGGTATFTVTANPAPAADLQVSVTVTASGDFGVSTGAQTITIPSGGSATVSIPTTDDSADEPNGSITLTLNAGNGYTVGALASETVAIVDDDAAPLVINQPRTMSCTPAAIPEGASGHLDCEVTDASWGRVQIKYSDRTLASQYGVAIEGIPAGTVNASSPCFRGDVETGQFRLTYASAGDGIETANLGEIRFKWQPVDPAQGDKCQWITKPTDLGSVSIADDWSPQPVEVPEVEEPEVDVPPPPPTPELSISAGAGVTEGGDAQFTVSANPAPSSPLTVSVTVSQSGDFGAATGSRTVTVPISGSVSFSIATTDDSTDEPDGSVSATVNGGDGYTVSTSQASATVSVADDDAPVVTPQVRIAAGGGVTEGGDAQFTITASPALQTPLTVSVKISQNGDFGAATGSRTVIIPTSGSVSFSVATVDDSTDEPDGSVSASVNSGSGYTVGSASSATVTVADDDDPAPVVVPQGPLTVSVAGDTALEGDELEFVISLSHASDKAVLVVYVTRGLSGTEVGKDFVFADGTLMFQPGDTEQRLRIATLADGAVEGEERMTLELVLVNGAKIANRNGIGVIIDGD